MLDGRFEVELVVDEAAEGYPELYVVVGGRDHGLVLEKYLIELHELTDLLRREESTMERLLLWSSFRQISVMY